MHRHTWPWPSRGGGCQACAIYNYIILYVLSWLYPQQFNHAISTTTHVVHALHGAFDPSLASPSAVFEGSEAHVSLEWLKTTKLAKNEWHISWTSKSECSASKFSNNLKSISRILHEIGYKICGPIQWFTGVIRFLQIPWGRSWTMAFCIYPGPFWWDPMGKTCEKRLGFQTTPFSTNQMATNKGSRAQISKVPLVNLPVCEILIGGIPLCRFKDWDWDVHWIFPDINRYQLLINHQTTSLWCRPLSLELQFLMLLLPELLQHPILLPHWERH